MTANDHANTVRQPLERELERLQAHMAEAPAEVREAALLPIRERIAALDALQTQAEQWQEIGEAFLDAWWEWEPGDDTDALDKAASEAMSLRGDVIRLARPKDES